MAIRSCATLLIQRRGPVRGSAFVLLGENGIRMAEMAISRGMPSAILQ